MGAVTILVPLLCLSHSLEAEKLLLSYPKPIVVIGKFKIYYCIVQKK